VKLKAGRRIADKPLKNRKMPIPLFALILEDTAADFDLMAHELERFGFDARCERVETEADFSARLWEHPDIIIADYSIAGFDNVRALQILQHSGLVIPLIVVTGAVREEQVVECMKMGAADYLLKDRMIRLGPAVLRALEERDLRRKKLRTEQDLRQKNLELEELYRLAQAASRTKSMFLANMSHELRTPLTAVIGCSEVLVDGKLGALTVDQLDFAQDILTNGKHLLGLINDVLDLARVESGMMPFRPEWICLPNFVRETLSGLRLLATRKNITLLTEVDTSAVEVFEDRQKLKQILLNYISNALKFTPPGGIVTVRAHPADDSVLRLEVEDSGIGIAPDDIKLLFQDFHQLDGGLSKQVQGTGLGLALTKRLVEAQGGTVGVLSVLGKGCTFFADLPCSVNRMMSDLEALSAAISEQTPAFTEPDPTCVAKQGDLTQARQ
jgi:signal transduction histidine kinase